MKALTPSVLVEGCYALSVGGGDFDEEISWTLSNVER